MKRISKEELEVLRVSELFDEEWYLEQYPDVKMLGMDPLEHYLWVGARIGRSPSPVYRERDVELLAAMRQISAVPRDEKVLLLATSRLLDAPYVCKQLNIPLDTDNQRVAELYYNNSSTDRLRPNPLFDPEFYRSANDLGTDIDAIEHYLKIGAERHLPCHYLFDVDWYKSCMPSAVGATDPVAHYWEFGYPEKILPCDPAKVEILPEVSAMFFAGMHSADHSAFSLQLYRLFNPDLSGMGDDTLLEHYENAGRPEGRIASMAALCQSCNIHPHFLPIDFTPQGYADVHLDLADLFARAPWSLLLHYLTHGLSEGRAYNLHQLFGYFESDAPDYSTEAVEKIEDKMPLCVLVHLYYPEMWEELNSYIDNIDVKYDLYINLVDTTWSAEIVGRIRADRPMARIFISPNAGRDVGGYFRLLDSINFDSYVAFATIHSKKSPHVPQSYSDRWKQGLIGATLGSRDLVRQNIAAFIEDNTIGIIGAGKHRHVHVDDNAYLYNHLLELYEINGDSRDCEYVSGTMMMIRSSVMQAVYGPLKKYRFESGDGRDMAFYIDGQMEHAVERIFGNVMKNLGYRFLWR